MTLLNPKERSRLIQYAEKTSLKRKGKAEKRNRLTGRLSGKRIEVTWQGKTQCLADWARELGISPQVIGERLHRGYPLDVVFRQGRIGRAEHPESNVYQFRNGIEPAWKALLLLRPLHRNSLTTNEILRLIDSVEGPFSSVGRAFSSVQRVPGAKIKHTKSLFSVLNVLKNVRDPRFELCRLDNKWQIKKIA